MTASAKPITDRASGSPRISQASASVMKGCTSCTWPTPRNTAARHAAVPEEKADIHREHRHVGKTQPGLPARAGNRLHVRPRQPQHHGRGQRRRQHQRPANHLWPTHGPGQPRALGVADCRQQHRAEHQQIGAMEAAPVLVQCKGDHQERPGQRHGRETERRFLVATQGREQRRGQRQNADQHRAVRGRQGLKRDRCEPRKTDDAADRHHAQGQQRSARREGQTPGEQPRQRKHTGGHGAPERNKDRRQIRHGEPRCGQRQAKNGHADQAKQHAAGFIGQAAAGRDGDARRHAHGPCRTSRNRDASTLPPVSGKPILRP